MKFVSVSFVGMTPLWANSGLFTAPGFIVSLVGIKKEEEEEEGREKRYKWKERRN